VRSLIINKKFFVIFTHSFIINQWSEMEYFNSEYFVYENNELFCEEVAVKEVISRVGTPVYIYSKKYFIDRYNEFDRAFELVPHTIFFACKSNFNLSVIKIFGKLGSGIDVNSEGELFRALKAGISPDKIIFSGVGKTPEEIKLCIEKNLLMIKAESFQELQVISDIAGEVGKIAPVSLRVNPDVDAETHPYISTGLAENKFGINSDSALNILTHQKNFPNIKFVGMDMHIGSQITSVEPLISAVEKLAALHLKLKNEGITLEHFDIGGGVGVKYKNERPFQLIELASAIVPTLKKLGSDIFFEPGRYLTANAGIFVTKVLYTKKNHSKNFIIVDGAMNDLVRPSMYSAYHHIQPIEIAENRNEIIADIVGPVCESSDFLGKNRKMLDCLGGEYLSVMSAGAYGMVMSSNYNGRRRPAEVLVDGNKFHLIRSRETFEHLIYDEENLLIE
jgi:diaminopimelate decarboxylase